MKRATFELQKGYMAKTTPTSIRFEKEQLDFLMEQEKLKSPQKAVNFLLQQYWINKNLVPRVIEAANQIAAIEEVNVKNLNPKKEEIRTINTTQKPFMSDAIKKKLGL